jgi:hypothetical protein
VPRHDRRAARSREYRRRGRRAHRARRRLGLILLKPLTLKVLALLIACLAALIAAGFAEIPYLMDAGGWLVIGLLLTLYLFNHIGIPGLLEHGGYCGWGTCDPTPFGFVFLAAFVLVSLWLLAWALASALDAVWTSRVSAGRRD